MSKLSESTHPRLKKITINSNSVDEIFKRLSHAFNTTFKKNHNEYSFKIPDEFGEGVIEAVTFDGGISTINYRCKFFTEVQLFFKGNTASSLKFLYNLNGKLPHLLEERPEYKYLQPYQRTILSGNKHHGHTFFFYQNKLIHFNCLQIDRSPFRSKMHTELENLCPELQCIFGDITSQDFFYHQGNFSLKIADLLKEIEEFDENTFLKKIFLEGKTYQILGLHLRQYQQDLKTHPRQCNLRSCEVERIKNVSLHIQQNISTIKTVAEYAKMASLNVNKLQLGFQQLYKNTVNQYIQNIRLEKAQELLASTDYNISEIVDKIGLSSKSYFSKLFRENYHLTPSEYRKKNQVTLTEILD